MILSKFVAPAFCFLLVLGMASRAEDPQTQRDVEGVVFTRDATIIQEMRDLAMAQMESWPLLKGEEGQLQREAAESNKASVDLPAAQRRKKDPSDIYALGREGTLMAGRLYICNKCDKIHFNVAFTAFAISEEGHIVTNYHCLDSFKGPSGTMRELHGFVVRSWDGRVFPVTEILAGSKAQDVAILKVGLPEGETLTPLSLGKTAEVGDSVYTISHPKQMLYRFSSGMVTRNIAENSPRAASDQPDRYRMCISADYGVGSSGGPVLDQRGNVVGVISSTTTVYHEGGRRGRSPQMVEKKTIPVAMLRELITEVEE